MALLRLGGDGDAGQRSRACGTLLLPVVALGVVLLGLTAWPHDRRRAGRPTPAPHAAREVASRGGILESGNFRGVGDRTVFVTERDRENNLRGVMISDRSDPERPFFVFAERGRFVFESETLIAHLQLENGDVHLDDESGDPNKHGRIAFQALDYSFDVGVLLSESRSKLKAREMTFRELCERLVQRFDRGEKMEDPRVQQPITYRLELQRRLALPVAPLLFALVGVPLGLRRARGARSWGALLCIAVVFGYYTLLSVSQFLGGDGVIPPVAARVAPERCVRRTGRLPAASRTQPERLMPRAAQSPPAGFVCVERGPVVLVADTAFATPLERLGLLEPGALGRALAGAGGPSGRGRLAVRAAGRPPRAPLPAPPSSGRLARALAAGSAWQPRASARRARRNAAAARRGSPCAPAGLRAGREAKGSRIRLRRRQRLRGR